MQPTLAQMRIALGKTRNPIEIQNIGSNEAPSMSPKAFVSPDGIDNGLSTGGVSMRNGMPVGGIDMSQQQAGQQMMPQQQGGLPPQGQPPQPPQGPQGAPTGAPPMGNMLSMTPQGQALGAMGGAQQPPQKLADGGSAKTKFSIATAQKIEKDPEHFTPYDKDNPNVSGLSTAFNEAIAHHLSLSSEDKKRNSIRAAEKVGDIIGRTNNNIPKDLLGKNEKLLKSEKGYEGGKPVKLPDGRGIETTGLALSPAYKEGKFNTCPNHASCKDECLGKTSGAYFRLSGGKNLEEFKGPRLNSLKKTHAFLHDPHSFAVKLHDEIDDAKAIAAQNGNHLGVRLNVISDIDPKVYHAIIKSHPDVTFYDYTKMKYKPLESNHHYTYSSTGVSQAGVENTHTNWHQMRRRLLSGENVAMAFTNKDHLPDFVHDQETGHKFKVINGDSHDFRPLDIQPEGEHGVIVGLKNKNALAKKETAHIDSKGFTVHYDPQLKMSKNKFGEPAYERMPSTKINPKTGMPILGETIPQNKIVNIQPQKRGVIPISNDGEKA